MDHAAVMPGLVSGQMRLFLEEGDFQPGVAGHDRQRRGAADDTAADDSQVSCRAHPLVSSLADSGSSCKHSGRWLNGVL